MKVLQIGQLPKEIGGNYTTGAANVVYELSRKQVDGVKLFTYGTNISDNVASANNSYPNQYLGYKVNVRCMLWILTHPLRVCRSVWHYLMVDHGNMLRYMFYEVNIRDSISLIKPDIIHVHSIGNLSPAYFARGKDNIPILLTSHGIFYRGEKYDKIGRDRYLGNINLADAYSGLTNAAVNEYQTILGINKEIVSVIPNGVDCARFYFDKKEREICRNELDASAGTTVFVTVASVQERKGQFAFIKILEKLNIDYQYWIIGTGNDVSKIEMYVNLHNLEKKIKLLGYHSADELYKFYSAADIYAHVSTKEGQALSEIEANATGLRILVNERIRETIPSLNSEDYFFYKPEFPQIKEILAWVLCENDSRQSRRSLDWQVIAEKYALLYKSILSSK